MSHPLEDPNNHAPPPAEDAEWDDAFEGCEVLSRHLLADAGDAARATGPVAVDGEGLRIAPRGVIEPRLHKAVRGKVEAEVTAAVVEDEGPVQVLVIDGGAKGKWGKAAEDEAAVEMVEEEKDVVVEGFEVNEIVTEVVRLESAEPLRGFVPERTEPEFSPAPPRVRRRFSAEAKEWGVAQKQARGWMWVWGIGVVGLLLVGLMVQPFLVGRDEVGKEDGGLALVEEESVEPVAGFDFDGKSAAEARRVLAQYATAGEVGEVLPLLRDAERVSAQVREGWKGWQAPAGWMPDVASSWEMNETEGRGFGVMTGYRPDFEVFRVYFVREEEAIRIDWEATNGVSETAFADLAKGRGKGGLVRVWARKGEFHTLNFPEEKFRALELFSPDEETLLWGYAARGGVADEALGEIFDDGLILTADAATVPITLRIEAAPPGSLPNQWIISEFLFPEWVTP